MITRVYPEKKVGIKVFEREKKKKLFEGKRKFIRKIKKLRERKYQDDNADEDEDIGESPHHHAGKKTNYD